MTQKLIKYRCEIPSLWYYTASKEELDHLQNLLWAYAFYAYKDVTKQAVVYELTTTREILTELGPLIESMYR